MLYRYNYKTILKKKVRLTHISEYWLAWKTWNREVPHSKFNILGLILGNKFTHLFY